MSTDTTAPRPSFAWSRLWLPAGVFVALIVLLGVGLTLNPREVPSPLIGKPAPDFELPLLLEPNQTFSPKQLAGQVWMLNVWASWCTSCRQEHAVLEAFAKSSLVPVFGLNYKDERADGIAYLKLLGNPYRAIAYDPQGRVGLDYGVYGTPETYVIDKRGFIRYKRIGPLTPDIIRQKIIPLVDELQRS